MSERFLVSKRRAARSGLTLEAAADRGAVRAEIQNAAPELTVERVAADGAIVRMGAGAEGAADSRAVLERSGYRVKRLPETELIRVGDFAVDVEQGLVAEAAEDTAASDPQVPADLRVPPEQEETWPHHLVQLIAPPTPEWVARIEEQGVNVIEPISRYALFVYAPPERVRALRGLKMPDDPPDAESFVAWTGPFQPAYRLAPEVLRLLDTAGPVQYLRVGVCPEEEADAVQGRIEGWHGRVVERWEETGKYNDRIGFLIAELDASWISALAREPHVRLIELQSDRLSTEDERSAQIVAQAFDNAPPPNTAPTPGYAGTLTGFGIDGRGVVVGICDTGVDTNDDTTIHPDLRGRLAFFQDVTGGLAPRDRNGHGTHVAGIAVGNGASGAAEPGPWNLGQGVAPGARFGVINPVDTAGSPGLKPVDNYTRILVGGGAHVMNNSWREGLSGGYTAGAALIDRLVRDPNGDNGADPARNYLVLVFSAGNSGPGDGTITHPKEAKNPIVVGNSLNRRASGDDIRGVDRTSSRGPARDGRILPTVVAPGQRIVSARSTSSSSSAFRDAGGTNHSQHTEKAGTSMAAPHVSGVCALLIQWWRDRTAALPSPALLKALLINGAVDLADGPDGRTIGSRRLGHIPNNDQGWGRVSLRNLLRDHPDTDRGPRLAYDREDLALNAAGDERIFTVTPARPGAPLRITLVWTDPPGAANAIPALVNDLDLEVAESVGGQTTAVYKGNVFDQGFSVPDTGEFDTLNNVECVYVREAREGAVYEVRVIASTLTQSARPPFTGPAWQDFALVIDNAVEAAPPV